VVRVCQVFRNGVELRFPCAAIPVAAMVPIERKHLLSPSRGTGARRGPCAAGRSLVGELSAVSPRGVRRVARVRVRRLFRVPPPSAVAAPVCVCAVDRGEVPPSPRSRPRRRPAGVGSFVLKPSARLRSGPSAAVERVLCPGAESEGANAPLGAHGSNRRASQLPDATGRPDRRPPPLRRRGSRRRNSSSTAVRGLHGSPRRKMIPQREHVVPCWQSVPSGSPAEGRPRRKNAELKRWPKTRPGYSYRPPAVAAAERIKAAGLENTVKKKEKR